MKIKYFSFLLLVALFSLTTGCDKEEELVEVSFTVVNTTDGTLLIEYDFIAEDCELTNNCGIRQEISDLARPNSGRTLYITDEVAIGFDIETLFDRFQLYKDLAPSNFVFWNTDKLTQTQANGSLNYTLTVDEDFFQ